MKSKINDLKEAKNTTNKKVIGKNFEKFLKLYSTNIKFFM